MTPTTLAQLVVLGAPTDGGGAALPPGEGRVCRPAAQRGAQMLLLEGYTWGFSGGTPFREPSRGDGGNADNPRRGAPGP